MHPSKFKMEINVIFMSNLKKKCQYTIFKYFVIDLSYKWKNLGPASKSQCEPFSLLTLPPSNIWIFGFTAMQPHLALLGFHFNVQIYFVDLMTPMHMPIIFPVIFPK